jgi:phage terminase large subunit GpA-like protein
MPTKSAVQKLKTSKYARVFLVKNTQTGKNMQNDCIKIYQIKIKIYQKLAFMVFNYTVWQPYLHNKSRIEIFRLFSTRLLLA